MGMIEQADKGIFYCPPDNVIRDYPQYPVTRNYTELETLIRASLLNL